MTITDKQLEEIECMRGPRLVIAGVTLLQPIAADLQARRQHYQDLLEATVALNAERVSAEERAAKAEARLAAVRIWWPLGVGGRVPTPNVQIVIDALHRFIDADETETS